MSRGSARLDTARGLGALVADLVGRVVDPIHDTHAVIAARIFGAVGPVAEPVRLVHDGVSALAYGAVASGATLVDAVSAHRAPERLASTVGGVGGLAAAAMNGFFGDDLAARRSPWEIEMTWCDELAGAAPASPRVAVFVHGLAETEEAWWWFDGHLDGEPARSFGDRLADEAGFSVRYVRYNSGLPVAHNGARLSELLEQLVADWPVPLDEIVLVGHSMGGLVIHRAFEHAGAAGLGWRRRARHTVSLGAPHRGAGLERFVEAAVRWLTLVPETRPLAGFLQGRSIGIKDLATGGGPTTGWADGSSGTSHHFVSATVTASPDHLVGRLVGDLLVRRSSAEGPPRDASSGVSRHFGRRHHLQLLGDPEVGDHLVDLLASPPDRPGGR